MTLYKIFAQDTHFKFVWHFNQLQIKPAIFNLNAYIPTCVFGNPLFYANNLYSFTAKSRKTCHEPVIIHHNSPASNHPPLFY